ncbi:MAG: tetratricopeptide repeat protein [Myxococcales bacterium]|nr:tetratricopeptide repeat protein [Myxococcales bacterium]
MYSLLISLTASVLTTIGVGWLFGRPSISFWAGFFPGLVVLVGVWIYLARRTGKRLEALMMRFQAELQPKGMAKPDKDRVERGIAILKTGYELKNWNFLVKSQLDGHIGMAYYVDRKFEEAEPHLEGAMGRHWIAKAMLAVLYFKRREYDKMKQTFEKALRWTKKEAFLWCLYAWCVWKNDDRDGAIDILSRGLDVLENDERLESNRAALQRNKKMKMRGWNEMWYQFHLDKPPQPKMQVDRRAVYRGR